MRRRSRRSSPRSLPRGSPSAEKPVPMTGLLKRRWKIASARDTSNVASAPTHDPGPHVSPGAATNGHARIEETHTSELLRIATAGSVDDGKSTLIGRLLYDSKQILSDQLEHVMQT